MTEGEKRTFNLAVGIWEGFLKERRLDWGKQELDRRKRREK